MQHYIKSAKINIYNIYSIGVEKEMFLQVFHSGAHNLKVRSYELVAMNL